MVSLVDRGRARSLYTVIVCLRGLDQISLRQMTVTKSHQCPAHVIGVLPGQNFMGRYHFMYHESRLRIQPMVYQNLTKSIGNFLSITMRESKAVLKSH